MKVISQVEFHVIEPSMAEDMVKKWLDSLDVNAELLNKRRKAKIKGYNDYEELIVDASQEAFKSFISADFVSKAGLNKDEIIAKRYTNMLDGYKKYQNKLDYLFETVDGIPAKRFKELIRRMAVHYGKNVAQKLLAFTGDKIRGLGCAVHTVEWLSGRKSFREGVSIEIVTGAPIAIYKEGLRSAFRSVLEQRLIQAGATIVRNKLVKSAIKRQNDLTNKLVNTLVEPTLNLAKFETDGDSCVDYHAGDEKFPFRIVVKVSQK